MSNKVNDFESWNEATNNYQVSNFIDLEKNCFGYAATNIGDTIVIVNGHRLFPSATPLTVVGDSFSITAPGGQLFKGQLKVVFEQPVGAAPNVEITQLYYLDKKKYTF